ncbi:vacuolar protein-sorting-associated protein 25-like [Ctenocephalides felis]|uniref:vacuolar protein-sorting-associated protein 25-like n=1 Tax=Ctenocephalides felis TaxID=7515 RepID=UPI000E6E2DF6|nr:vacuolar protein-sorting-associated protein 25-like [Ctenocephalides felis]XP_026474344.1 vacuolar protein-sorting-associated protein 25-like [Ctenocephalides felis]
MAEIEWPWQYSFPPFFTIQVHEETKSRQITLWRNLVLEYYKSTKQSTLDVGESLNSPLFNNAAIDRKLSQEGIVLILEDLAKTGNAAPLDKLKNRWEIYWHTLEEWASILYDWAQENGQVNTVLTLFELVSGEDTTNMEFYGLDTNVLIKALRKLESENKCELIMFDDNQGVKFF